MGEPAWVRHLRTTAACEALSACFCYLPSVLSYSSALPFAFLTLLRRELLPHLRIEYLSLLFISCLLPAGHVKYNVHLRMHAQSSTPDVQASFVEPGTIPWLVAQSTDTTSSE